MFEHFLQIYHRFKHWNPTKSKEKKEMAGTYILSLSENHCFVDHKTSYTYSIGRLLQVWPEGKR
jgi:hypothetical protein